MPLTAPQMKLDLYKHRLVSLLLEITDKCVHRALQAWVPAGFSERPRGLHDPVGVTTADSGFSR